MSPAGGAAHQPLPGPDDIRRHREGQEGVQPQPAGQPDGGDPQDHPDGGPDIGEQVMGVRFEGDGAVLAAGAQQDELR